MNANVNQPYESNLYLSLNGTPATGLSYEDVSVSYKKFMEDDLQGKTVEEEDWVELGGGFYSLRWSPEEMDTPGKFFFTAASPGFDNFLYGEFDVVEPPAPVEVGYPEHCVVSGSLFDINVQTAINTPITARIVKVPSAIGQALLTARSIVTSPNHLGMFELILPRGATVVVEIPLAGIRHQITVPNQATAQFLDLLPPLT